ncbi:MAG: type II toxin-antitoxin system VapC family toxin [Bacteroidota bacterium]
MKSIIVDTDILSYYFKKDEQVVKKFDTYIKDNNHLYISRVTVFEILSGLKYKGATKQLHEFREFIKQHTILEITAASIEISSEIFAYLRHKGKTGGRADILIAGIALANNFVLSTNNTKDYNSIPDIELVNWKK